MAIKVIEYSGESNSKFMESVRIVIRVVGIMAMIEVGLSAVETIIKLNWLVIDIEGLVVVAIMFVVVVVIIEVKSVIMAASDIEAAIMVVMVPKYMLVRA